MLTHIYIDYYIYHLCYYEKQMINKIQIKIFITNGTNRDIIVFEHNNSTFVFMQLGKENILFLLSAG